MITKEKFSELLRAFGHNTSTGHRLLGCSRASVYRMAKGKAEVPEIVERLLDMYIRFGVPTEHRQ